LYRLPLPAGEGWGGLRKMLVFEGRLVFVGRPVFVPLMWFVGASW
jgi:hypothetical protein